MRLCFYFFITLTSILLSFSACSQLYEAQGQAVIQNNDTAAARTQAIENALKKALLVAGASVSSVQQVVSGLLTQDEISIRASGNVNAMELIDEIHTNEMITVTIRADIFPQERQCFSADFRKSLLLTRSHLLYREQASIGEIYPVDKEIMKTLAKNIAKKSHYINAKLSLKNKNEFSRYNQSLEQEKIKQLAMVLATKTDSHYILFSEILDVSLNNDSQNNWQFWQHDVFTRNFSIVIYVYNGTTGELTYQKQYDDLAPWTFKKREKVAVNSQTFWQSEYGKMLTQNINLIVDELDENVMCEPTSAAIVALTGNQITFNLGTQHGVKVGDEFSLLHKNNFTSDTGITYPRFNVSDYKVKVIKVSKQSATAVTPDNRLLGNIQINDLAVRH